MGTQGLGAVVGAGARPDGLLGHRVLAAFVHRPVGFSASCAPVGMQSCRGWAGLGPQSRALLWANYMAVGVTLLLLKGLFL